MRLVHLIVLAIAGCSLFPATAAELGSADFEPSPDHPVGYRGDGSGRFPGATPPTSWSEKDVAWKVALPNWSNTGVIVAGGKVITCINPHTIIAYDATTGEKVWHNATDNFDVVGKTPEEAGRLRGLYGVWLELVETVAQHNKGKPWMDAFRKAAPPEAIKAVEEKLAAIRKGGIAIGDKELRGELGMTTSGFGKLGISKYGYGPAMTYVDPTPVSDGKHVWMSFGTQTIFCYDLNNGHVVWSALNPARTGFNDDLHHQFYASPVLLDGVLVVQAGRMLRGFEAATGTKLWEIDDGEGSCASPLPMRIGNLGVVVNRNGRIVAVKTGKETQLGWRLDDHSGPLFDGKDLLFFPGQKFQPTKEESKNASLMTFRLTPGPNDTVQVEQVALELGGGSQVYGLLVDTRVIYCGSARDLLTGKILGPFPAGKGYNGPIQGGLWVFSGGPNNMAVVDVATGKRVTGSNSLGALEETKHQALNEDQKASIKALQDRRTQALAEGVIGWIDSMPGHGGPFTCYGQRPFFQGTRMYFRTRQDIYAIGK